MSPHTPYPPLHPTHTCSSQFLRSLLCGMSTCSSQVVSSSWKQGQPNVADTPTNMEDCGGGCLGGPGGGSASSPAVSPAAVLRVVPCAGTAVGLSVFTLPSAFAALSCAACVRGNRQLCSPDGETQYGKLRSHGRTQAHTLIVRTPGLLQNISTPQNRAVHGARGNVAHCPCLSNGQPSSSR
jgi:hypothetical protein